MCHFRTRTQEPPLQWNLKPSAPTAPPLPLSGAHAGPAAAAAALGRERPRRGAGARCGAGGRARPAPCGSTWARAGCRASTAARTHGRAARGILGYVFARPERGPDTSFSTFSPPPPTPGEGGRRGGADGAARRVFSARASRIWGRRRRRCALARTFPRRAGHKDLGARCSPDPSPRGVSGAYCRATPALGLAALATPPAGWPPSPVKPELGKPKLCDLRLRSEARARGPSRHTLSPTGKQKN